MDPIFLGKNVKVLKSVTFYDSFSNKITIEESKEYEYIDFDGQKTSFVESETELIDLNWIKDVEVERIDTNTSWGICCCKTWKILYKIFHINVRNEKTETKKHDIWQHDKYEDKSITIRANELKNLKWNN